MLAALDLLDALRGVERSPLVPPRRMRFVGRGDFVEVGRGILPLFVDLAGLKPNHHVLDVGCGIGRMALPLTEYLDGGRYEGIDVARDGVTWCQQKFTPRFPSFRFQWADVHNEVYNPQGRNRASEYRFPFGDQQFDLVILTSVLTHLLPSDMEHYLSETSRVMKDNGRCFVTFFLINEESAGLAKKRRSTRNFNVEGPGGYRTIDPDCPETLVAYDETRVRDLYDRNDLILVEPVHYGSWCGRTSFLRYQDIVIARRRRRRDRAD